MSEEQLHQVVSKITRWLDSQGYEYNLHSNTYGVYESEKLLTTISSSRIRNKLEYVSFLLHECGHVNQPESNFSILRNSSTRSKCIVLELEYTAWVRGWTLARELAIDSEELRKVYCTLWSRYWTSYVDIVASNTHEANRVLADRYV